MEDRISRRDFLKAGLATRAIPALLVSSPQTSLQRVLDLAEWSYLWIGLERIKGSNGWIISGRQMYVEYQTPKRLRHGYPIVLMHGAGGQGSDWMSAPDGRPGWASYLLLEGYSVYIVDLPGMGRVPYHTELHGPYGPAPVYEAMERTLRTARHHTQWPGTGEIGDPALDQLMASRGQMPWDAARAREVWRAGGAALLDTIGPSIFLTHGAGAAVAWLAADARPGAVKGIVAMEPGMKSDGPLLQAPSNLSRVPVSVVSAEASQGRARDDVQASAFSRSGARVDHIQLDKHGVRGNGHFIMLEKNNREALQPILKWMDARIPPPSAAAAARPRPPASKESTAVVLSDQGGFWVGVRRKSVAYGTVAEGQAFVQFAIPAKLRHPYPVVLVHGGGGQGIHWMGESEGHAGWAHY